MKRKNRGAIFALGAALLYGINIPFSKLLLDHVGPTMMAALLYLGAGLGLGLVRCVRREELEPLEKKDLPYTVGMVVLDIAAPILLMLGLQYTGSANASLLNNFEIAATSAIAFFLFREMISRRLLLAILLVTAASALLSWRGSFRFDRGALLVLGAACCWGLENNCTRMLSGKSAARITTIKGIFSGLGSLTVAFLAGERIPQLIWIPVVLALGFLSYGLSITFYIRAQKDLGAAKTSAYYSAAPFLGILFGIALGERPGWQFAGGLVLMVLAMVLMLKDTIALQHTHDHVHIHSHEHAHGDLVHTHAHSHAHTHTHVHGGEEEVHSHTHETLPGHDHAHLS